MKAVVFDMDGVIFDSERLVMEVWEELGRIHHFDHAKEICFQCLGTNKQVSRTIFLDYYGEDFPYDDYAKESSRMYHERYDGKVPLKSGVKELLNYLRKHHYLIALASSTREYTVKLQLNNAGIIEAFDAIICGDMVKRSKPDPEIYLKACECLGVQPEEAYAIEDSYNGIRSAYNAHLHPLMVPDLKEPNEEMYEKAEAILDDLLQVMKYIEVNEHEEK